jgi:hypothetical protein
LFWSFPKTRRDSFFVVGLLGGQRKWFSRCPIGRTSSCSRVANLGIHSPHESNDQFYTTLGTSCGMNCLILNISESCLSFRTLFFDVSY